MNNGAWGFLETLSLFLACLGIMRVLFGVFYILKFKFLTTFYSQYATFKFDMLEDAK